MKKSIKEKRETECYYPECKEAGIYPFGRKNAHFMFCEKHFNLAVFIADMFDFNFENR